MKEKKLPALSESEYLEQRIDEFKKSTFTKEEKNEEIIGLFNYIVVTTQLDKKHYFEKIYNLDKKNKIFTEINKKIIGIINQGHLELLDWVCEKEVDNIKDVQKYYQANIQLIKRCHKISITEYLINRNFPNLTKEEFKDNILKPIIKI